MTEKTKVLDLRFIVLPSGVVMEVLAKDLDSLGWNPDKRDKYTGTRTDLQNTLIVRFLCTTGATLLTRESAVEGIDEPIRFDEIKSALTEFANSSAFFGDEKPVPDIRFEDAIICGAVASLLKESRPAESEKYQKQYAEVLEHFKNSPIYAPKRYKSEWAKEFPRELKKEDFVGRIFPIDDWNDVRLRDMFGDIDSGLSELLTAINQLQQSDIEIHRFSMWEE